MPWNRKQYPANWEEIRRVVLERAHWCCEGSPVYPECRAVMDEPHPVTASRVVLTVAHLDHTPSTSDVRMLRAWCQRCHLTYDAQHHAANAAATRRRKKENPQQLGLF